MRQNEMFYSLSELPPDEAIIEAYLRSSSALIDADEEPWPADAVRLLVYRDPHRAWHLLCRLIDAAPPGLLASIGTGPLEEFVNRYGDNFVHQIEAAARSDKFVRALANVWLSRGTFAPEVESRLVSASGGAILLLNVQEEPPS